jgi:hypothetical protein
VQEDLAALRANAPGGHHRLTRLASTKPLGNAVDEQVDDPMLAEVSRRERLVLSPQPVRNLAHRRAAQQTTACIVGERVLDVPRRQPACIELDRQILERAGPASDVLPDRRNERLGRLAHLGRCELHHPLRRLQPPFAIAIAVAARLALRPLIAFAANLVPHLAFERFFKDQLRRQEHQVRPVRGRPQPTIHQGPKALACSLRGGYSSSSGCS